MGLIVPILGLFGFVNVKSQNSLIADALFTKTQQRVLAILYGKPGRSFYVNEIVRRASVGRGAVSRELKKLQQAGLITTEPQGNQSHYQANSNNPIFDDLRGIVIKTFGIVDVLREGLTELLPLMQIAFVYGSIAKGMEDADSDIDILIVADKLTYANVMKRLEPSERQLRRVINPTIYSVKEFEAKKSSKSFLKRVMEQPKLWLKD
jgi:DNA-binding transcriptional ArsR family regulator